jgi:hypothetical protein
VEQRRGLQRVPYSFRAHVIPGDAVQLAVNERHQTVEGTGLTVLRLFQQGRHLSARVRHL